jgi:hypothetical protein
MRQLTVLLPFVSFALLSGCGSDPIPFYDPCTHVNQCEAAATRCQFVEVEYPSPPVIASGLFCTDLCGSDGECPIGANGTRGACLSLNFPVDPTVCYQRCEVHEDCAPGWRCEVVGDPPSPPICVPSF